MVLWLSLKTRIKHGLLRRLLRLKSIQTSQQQKLTLQKNYFDQYSSCTESEVLCGILIMSPIPWSSIMILKFPPVNEIINTRVLNFHHNQADHPRIDSDKPPRGFAPRTSRFPISSNNLAGWFLSWRRSRLWRWASSVAQHKLYSISLYNTLICCEVLCNEQKTQYSKSFQTLKVVS